jgi:hypothetical protein
MDFVRHRICIASEQPSRQLYSELPVRLLFETAPYYNHITPNLFHQSDLVVKEFLLSLPSGPFIISGFRFLFRR